MGKRESTERDISFDLLRIISALSVVVLHVSGKYISASEVCSADFRMANFINSISRFGVPIFVMISGAIFLSEEKNVTIGKIWRRNILRMFVIFVVWSFGYYVFQSLYFWQFDFWRQGVVRTITGCVYASDHFWFIFMIIGLYALVPLLRTWVHNATQKELYYFTGLFFIFQIARTTVTILIDKSLVLKISDMVKITELTGYLGYFVLGYVLIRYGISQKLKVLIYGMVPVGVVANYWISDYMSGKNGAYSPGIYDCFGIFTFLHIVAIFLFFTDFFAKIQFGKRAEAVITNIAKDTLGIYVMHVGLLEYLVSENVIIGSFQPFVGIILLSVVCFAVCCLTAALLRRIPYVGRFLC